MVSKIRNSDGGWIMVGDRMAQVDPNGGLCTVPLIIGTLFDTKPKSPLYYDQAAHLRSIQVENRGGKISVRFWRSMSMDPAVNDQAIKDAITLKLGDDDVVIPQPDMTNHKWTPLTDIDYGIQFDLGISEVPQNVIRAARQSRWLKIDPIYGAFTDANFWPTFAGQ